MTTAEETQVDLEELAAYVDGLLDSRRRRAVEARLVRDEGYYQVYLATVRALEEDVPELSPPAGRRTQWWKPIWGLVAAAILAAVVFWRPAGPSDVGGWVAGLDATQVVAQSEWDRLGWTPARSESGLPPSLTASEKMFRLGVRSIDLEVALQAADLEKIDVAARRMADLSASLELYQRKDYVELASSAREEAHGIPDLAARAVSLTTALSHSLDVLEPTRASFTAGRWLQATRLAALVGDRTGVQGLLGLAPGREPFSNRFGPDGTFDAEQVRSLSDQDRLSELLDELVHELDRMSAQLGG